MKQWVGYISIFFILFSSLTPCSFFDHCEERAGEEQHAANGDEHDCKSCSPFSICSQQQVSPPTHWDYCVAAIPINLKCSYNTFIVASGTDYHARLLQPPRC